MTPRYVVRSWRGRWAVVDRTRDDVVTVCTSADYAADVASRLNRAAR